MSKIKTLSQVNRTDKNQAKRLLLEAIAKALPYDFDPNVALNWAEEYNTKSLANALRKALLPEETIARKSYPFLMDYRKSVDELVKAGCYVRPKGMINSQRFPVEEKEREGGTHLMFLINFKREIPFDELCDRIDVMGYRFSNIHEFLSFAARYPKIQCELDAEIVTFGTLVIKRFDGIREFPYIYQVRNERYLDTIYVYSDKTRFGENEWFAVMYK